ncbi:hypothetical protein Lal_00021114 [Lupinus albus]|nr:hypothetical protein Lal_00021114 [Lupinus albus]
MCGPPQAKMIEESFFTDDEKVLFNDFCTTNVAGIRDVEMQFAFRKNLILNDVMYTPYMRNNLVYVFLLNKVVFTQTIRADLYNRTCWNSCSWMPLVGTFGCKIEKTHKSHVGRIWKNSQVPHWKILKKSHKSHIGGCKSFDKISCYK